VEYQNLKEIIYAVCYGAGIGVVGILPIYLAYKYSMYTSEKRRNNFFSELKEQFKSLGYKASKTSTEIKEEIEEFHKKDKELQIIIDELIRFYS
jgi:hypothetical protein